MTKASHSSRSQGLTDVSSFASRRSISSIRAQIRPGRAAVTPLSPPGARSAQVRFDGAQPGFDRAEATEHEQQHHANLRADNSEDGQEQLCGGHRPFLLIKILPRSASSPLAQATTSR